MEQLNSASDAIALVRRFRQVRVLVIGDVMLDTYLEGAASRLCSEGPVPVVRKTMEQRLPGGAANTAANLRALEADVLLLGVIGHDDAGRALRTVLREQHINDQWLVEDTKTSTQHKLRVLADGQYVVRFDEGDGRATHVSPYTPACQQRLATLLAELYAQCDVVVISDYGYGVLSDTLIAQLTRLHAAQPKALLIDSKALLRFRELPATIITPNYQEAALLAQEITRHELPDLPIEAAISRHCAHVEQVAHVLLSALATAEVAITLGKYGVFLLNRHGHRLHIPAHPVEQANDVGAGDSFAAAFALALAAQSGTEEAARIALDAAAISVSKARTATVQYQELLQRVSLRVYTSRAHQWQEHDEGSALAGLAAQLEVERLLGRTIVFTNGVFDILHAGHVQFLRQAKGLGDVLVVAVNSDRSARRLKGNGRPINHERDRLALVAALDMVDYVLLFDADTPTGLIDALRPHLHVKGGDYANEPLPEAEAVQRVGGKVVILPLVGSVSTSSVIGRIVELTRQQSNKSESKSVQ